MKRETPVLSFDASVTSAIEFLKNESRGFAIVAATADRFHGVLTEAQLVRIFLRFQADPSRESLILYRDLFEPAQLVHEDEVFPNIVKKLVTAVGHRVFVINNETKVVGYITAKDILPYFSTQGPTATEDKKLQENISSDLYLYESFFAKSPFMIHSVNREGIITMANEMLHEVLGYEYGELIGKTIFDLYPAEAHKEAEKGLKTILTEGRGGLVKAEMVTKGGGRIPVEMVSRALSNQFQHSVGTMTVSHPKDMEILLRALPDV